MCTDKMCKIWSVRKISHNNNNNNDTNKKNNDSSV